MIYLPFSVKVIEDAHKRRVVFWEALAIFDLPIIDLLPLSQMCSVES